MEAELIRRMALREVLKDDQMAARLAPSMSLVEQLLRDKGNLSGNALKNARALIQQYIEQLAEVLRLQVMKAVRGKIDRSVPPKRVFRNLDLKRTIWKNLPNYNPGDGRLYVDQLYYRPHGEEDDADADDRGRRPVGLDGRRHGAMHDPGVDLRRLPRVDVHLLAFDTQVLDLTPWVHDPFEVLMRTNLGGGTLICNAPDGGGQEDRRAAQHRPGADFRLLRGRQQRGAVRLHQGAEGSGVRFIPVGAVTSSGYFSVNQWFRDRLKELGTPILSGHIKKLIGELKTLL